ncbi:MAG TPA: sigma-70 family RNA polymerase sigma factor [Verrucomicrobiae bacterium]|nr:sigma-70 family RNA polymerase sigma factor [Verrucomicrobiae bacterium]
MTISDLDLLRQYTRKNSETAFAELVSRHLNLVYSAALRQVRSPQLAEEVAQSTFTDLAQNATRLAADTVLSAWLYQVSHRTAIDVVRREARRQLREQIATEMNSMNATDADWTAIAPLLDDAMHALDETDRTAILLRYFENKSLREVGLALGTSDDAAQKRVSRAVERLREFFSQRGVVAGASALAIILSANAVQAAPTGLSTTIATTAVAGTALATATATTTVAAKIAMTTIQKALVTAVIIVAVGAGIHQAQRAAKLQTQLDTLQQQQDTAASAGNDALASLRSQIDSLTSQNADLTRSIAQANADKSRLETERQQALHGEAVFKELASESNDKNSTNEYPTARHVAVGFGRLVRTYVALTNVDVSKLSDEEKMANEMARMDLAGQTVALMKAMKQFDATKPPGEKEDGADTAACLLYGALDLNEEQFGQIYSLMQKYRQQTDLVDLSDDKVTPEATAAINQIDQAAKQEINAVLTPEQAQMFGQMTNNFTLLHGHGQTGRFSFNFDGR